MTTAYMIKILHYLMHQDWLTGGIVWEFHVLHFLNSSSNQNMRIDPNREEQQCVTKN